jgi:acylphosphatase
VSAARARLLVTGLVQGVGFRQATAAEARRLGLGGWVRNLADGRVEAVAEGRRDRVESLVAFAWRGPPAARVSQVEVEWGEAGGDLGPFRITG